jgi:hypothetical protein
MEVYHARLLLLLLPFILIAVGCAPRWDADTKAQRFFDKGRAQILADLEESEGHRRAARARACRAGEAQA